MQQVQFWFIKSDPNQCFQHWPGSLCLDATRNLPTWTVPPLHSQTWPSCVFPLRARFLFTTTSPLLFFLKWSDLIFSSWATSFLPEAVRFCFFGSHFSAVLSEPICFHSCCGKTDQVPTKRLRPGVIFVSKTTPFCFQQIAYGPVQVVGSDPFLILLHHVYWVHVSTLSTASPLT